MAQNPNLFYELGSRFTSGLSEDPTQKMKNLSRALIQIPVGKETVPRLQMTVDFLWIPSRIWFWNPVTDMARPVKNAKKENYKQQHLLT